VEAVPISTVDKSCQLVRVCESSGALVPQRPSDEEPSTEESLRLDQAAETLLAPQA